ncbi:hypothetical protein SAMN05216262_1049 [Colwellia chukchiensis]|uniref:Uncharacterized protein n=1 Tax=Colwellia chukchiensis TaxID=641665 RepID=A0A1H7L2Q2_9GAMM|nr:hypothetical protein [Colwellia chukchiensis]SEK92547.1 hypothetical protein SAMN05216262_1049 [Colwellia chukchiensis]
MKEFDVTMTFDTGENDLSLDAIDDLLFEGGFDDALISHSGTRLIQIELRRSASSEDFLIKAVMRQVSEIFPNSKQLN